MAEPSPGQVTIDDFDLGVEHIAGSMPASEVELAQRKADFYIRYTQGVKAGTDE